jgi:hypothetical protein
MGIVHNGSYHENAVAVLISCTSHALKQNGTEFSSGLYTVADFLVLAHPNASTIKLQTKDKYEFWKVCVGIYLFIAK